METVKRTFEVYVRLPDGTRTNPVPPEKRTEKR